MLFYLYFTPSWSKVKTKKSSWLFNLCLWFSTGKNSHLPGRTQPREHLQMSGDTFSCHCGYVSWRVEARAATRHHTVHRTVVTINLTQSKGQLHEPTKPFLTGWLQSNPCSSQTGQLQLWSALPTSIKIFIMVTGFREVRPWAARGWEQHTLGAVLRHCPECLIVVRRGI